MLDCATFIAAPFCGTLLGEFGAEVIKIEQPKVGDSLRRLGTPTETGDTLNWFNEARNKESVTLDLGKPEGAEIFKRLAGVANVVLENFRPGTLERWGLGYDELAKVNPALVMLRVSAYGQTGPMCARPGFARIAHAFSGLAYLAGEPGRAPVVPGSTSLADYASGLFGAVGVLIALRHAERTGVGQVVDVALYESMFRVLDEIAPAYAKFGAVRERMGSDSVNIAPHSNYETRDRQWVALACSNDRMWHRLTIAMNRPDLGEDPRYATAAGRVTHADEINDLVRQWTAQLDCDQVVAACDAVDMPCSKLLSIADIFSNEHYAARKNLLKVDDPRAGVLIVPAPTPRLSVTPGRIRALGQALGSGNHRVLGGVLGFGDEELARLASMGVI